MLCPENLECILEVFFPDFTSAERWNYTRLRVWIVIKELVPDYLDSLPIEPRRSNECNKNYIYKPNSLDFNCS